MSCLDSGGYDFLKTSDEVTSHKQTKTMVNSNFCQSAVKLFLLHSSHLMADERRSPFATFLTAALMQIRVQNILGIKQISEGYPGLRSSYKHRSQVFLKTMPQHGANKDRKRYWPSVAQCLTRFNRELQVCALDYHLISGIRRRNLSGRELLMGSCLWQETISHIWHTSCGIFLQIMTNSLLKQHIGIRLFLNYFYNLSTIHKNRHSLREFQSSLTAEKMFSI